MNNRAEQLEKLMGMGERSTRKSYYPELQKKIRALERFNLIVDRSHDIVVMVNCEDELIVDCNLTACRKLEYTRNDLLGLTMAQVFSQQVREKAHELQHSVAPECIEVQGELFVSTHDSIPVEVSLQRIRYERAEYLVFVARDISKRVQVQKDNKRLEQQLIQSQKMETIGTFAGGIAHDFNNLLQIISGNIQLMALKNRGNDPDTHIQAIEKATLKAGKLVKRLLTISRKVESAKLVISLNELITETMALSERIIPPMIAVELDLEPDLFPILADSIQLEQIILNLASNAFDALKQEGRITISTRQTSFSPEESCRYPGFSPGIYAQLVFSDNGPGMTEAVRKRIFDPFFTTKEVGKGTGLGLSTVYAIVKEHGGHVSCYSLPGQGTTFTLYFPALAESTIGGCPRLEDPKLPGMSMNKTILVIDDETMIADLAREIFENAGCRVITANSGEKGVSCFQREYKDIDLVLLDLGMPGMGGEKCLQLLRQIDSQGLFVVASGYLGHDISKNPQEYGAAAFLEKPFDSRKLLRTMSDVLKQD